MSGRDLRQVAGQPYGSETGFEEIGALATVNSITFPRTGLLARLPSDIPAGKPNQARVISL